MCSCAPEGLVYKGLWDWSLDLLFSTFAIQMQPQKGSCEVTTSPNQIHPIPIQAMRQTKPMSVEWGWGSLPLNPPHLPTPPPSLPTSPPAWYSMKCTCTMGCQLLQCKWLAQCITRWCSALFCTKWLVHCVFAVFLRCLRMHQMVGALHCWRTGALVHGSVLFIMLASGSSMPAHIWQKTNVVWIAVVGGMANRTLII